MRGHLARESDAIKALLSRVHHIVPRKMYDWGWRLIAVGSHITPLKLSAVVPVRVPLRLDYTVNLGQG